MWFLFNLSQGIHGHNPQLSSLWDNDLYRRLQFLQRLYFDFPGNLQRTFSIPEGMLHAGKFIGWEGGMWGNRTSLALIPGFQGFCRSAIISHRHRAASTCSDVPTTKADGAGTPLTSQGRMELENQILLQNSTHHQPPPRPTFPKSVAGN